MTTIGVYVLAAVLEIIGCYAAWQLFREQGGWGWWVGVVLPLLGFALLLTTVETEVAGRAFAAYGGIYIVTAMAWTAWVDNAPLTAWDITGGVMCVVGSIIIMRGFSS